MTAGGRTCESNTSKQPLSSFAFFTSLNRVGVRWTATWFTRILNLHLRSKYLQKMSLSSLLLASKAQKIDTELDALFKSNVTRVSITKVFIPDFVSSQPHLGLSLPRQPVLRRRKEK